MISKENKKTLVVDADALPVNSVQCMTFANFESEINSTNALASGE